MNTTNDTIKVCLADDHAMNMEGLNNVLSGEPDIEIVGVARDGTSLLELLESRDDRVDVLVLDLSMPGMSGMELIKKLNQKFPDLSVIVLTMHRESQFFRQATSNRNVRGYILKDDAYDRLRDALRTVSRGGRAFSPQIQELMFEDYQRVQEGYHIFEQLTRREREVLNLIVQGRMNKEIANDLFISIRTVESHRARIMEKLRCRNFAELMQFAARNGLV